MEGEGGGGREREIERKKCLCEREGERGRERASVEERLKMNKEEEGRVRNGHDTLRGPPRSQRPSSWAPPRFSGVAAPPPGTASLHLQRRILSINYCVVFHSLIISLFSMLVFLSFCIY